MVVVRAVTGHFKGGDIEDRGDRGFGRLREREERAYGKGRGEWL